MLDSNGCGGLPSHGSGGTCVNSEDGAVNRRARAALSVIGSANRARARAVHENVYLKLRARLWGLLQEPLPQGLRVLDLGCGYTYPNVALFNAAGIEACGADVESVFFRDGRLATFRQRLRERGLLRAVLCAGPRYTEDQRYFSELARLAQATLEHRTLSLHTYDGRRLPFADGTFDVVCSNAVLEHVEDLDAFVGETDRVLRTGGVVDMLWHNFYSPSGGHRGADDEARSPWGHVTGESPLSCFLNRKRPDEMLAAFEGRMTVLGIVGADVNHSLEGDLGFEPEGLDRLNEDWRSRLPGLSDRLLTTRGFLIQAAKEE